MFEKEIEAMLRSNGASLVGFSCVESAPSPDYPEFKYAVTIARKMSDTVIETIDGRPTMSYFQHYRITNTKLDLLALCVVDFIEERGFRALPVAASQSTPYAKGEYRGIFPHKTGALLSGLGYIGKNGLLITEEFGPRVRFATVLTDMPLKAQRPMINDGCGACLICKNACPAGAITGENYVVGAERGSVVDAKKCSDHMKTYNDVGRGAVCGICVAVCPKGKNKAKKG